MHGNKKVACWRRVLDIMSALAPWRAADAPTPGVGNDFLWLATQYYAAARWAILAGVGPVAGNLFHHALEFYLKADLSKTRSTRYLAMQGHNLKSLWKAFKRKHSSGSLDGFDGAVKALHKFERIRYPDGIAGKGMFWSLPVVRPNPPLTFSVAHGQTPPTYLLAMNEVDELVRVVLETSSESHVFVFGKVGAEARQVLHQANQSFVAP